MTHDAFATLVDQAVAQIPARFREAIHNLVLIIEDEPSSELLADMGLTLPDTLYGLYQGVPRTERTWSADALLPDLITLFQGPMERDATTSEDIRIMIAETLIHEVGHYFGLSEEEIEAIEEQYWTDKPDVTENDSQ